MKTSDNWKATTVVQSIIRFKNAIFLREKLFGTYYSRPGDSICLMGSVP